MKDRTRSKPRKPPAAEPLPEPAAPVSGVTRHQPVFMVGIGASAGGLEALEQFLQHVPAECGLAFVIVQHLDPTHRGVMPELLQRDTTMKVMQVKDRTLVQPDCVYVIPPNKDMSVLHGVLHLMEPAAPRGLRLPIDFFLRSLAQDQRERSVGVILSGMGSDGTQGLKAIREKSGMTLVQDPKTARFDGMPRSAIDAGLADAIVPVEEMPARIIAWHRSSPMVLRKEIPSEEGSRSALEKVVILLRAHTGHDFTQYKRNTLLRRIERRMGVHQILKMSDYVRYLRENPQELDLLFRELLIGVTGFFRDPEVWELMKAEVLPGLLSDRHSGRPFRAWVPGCSTGEEAYSLAMMLREVVGEFHPRGNQGLQIFATDLDRDAIDKARQGLYPESAVADVGGDRLARFFVREDQGYRVRKEIREMVIFATQNLIMDPPFTKLDLLSCRNLLIYLTAEVQRKLIPLFHYSLAPGGVLLLGSAETVGNDSELFAPIHGKLRFFRRLETAVRNEGFDFPTAFGITAAGVAERQPNHPPAASLQSQADQFILQRFAPPAVLVNDKGDILYVNGRTGRYLEPAAGKANWNIFVMAASGLRQELIVGFQRSLRRKEPVVLTGLRLRTDGGKQTVDVSIQRIGDPGTLQGLVMIVFTEPSPAVVTPVETRPVRGAAGGGRWVKLEQELRQARNEASATHEEMQTSQEEFRSANEELQSTNEELQSTNEELTTSKEEMQSLNEELQTVNAELQAKVDELSRASNDMKNLLDSTDIATLFLDNDLHIRRFTPQAARIIKLIPADAGRPITDLASDLDYPGLVEDSREVLRKLISMEKPVGSRDGRWFTVRIMPYRTLNDRIDGVVITFADITAARAVEAQLRSRHDRLEKRAKLSRAKSAGAKPTP